MRINTIIVLSLLVLTTLLGSGCADIQGAIAQTSAWRDEAVSVRDTLDQQVETLQTQQGNLEPGSPEAIAIETELKLTQAKRAALDAAIAQANQVLDEAQHPSDALTQIAHGISSWVPAPAQGPLVLGAALIATLARSRQLKQSSMSIISSISHVLERDEQFKSIFEQHADTIRSIQTPTARRLVDQTNRKRALSA
ncbi:MAG: hypothetical protein ACF8MF_13165 [Phycisphaerales bacterium JB052]